jgi:adenine-specific DNA-methyltransferase
MMHYLEKDQSTLEMVAYRDMWGKGTDSYLHIMYERLALMKELLSEEGSIYVHVDYRVSGLVRGLLDECFGRETLRSEIIWQKVRSIKWQSSYFGNIHDTIFFYGKSEHARFNDQYREKEERILSTHYRYVDEKTGKRYRLSDFTQNGDGPARKLGDRVLSPPSGKHWIWSQDRIDQAMMEGQIVFSRTGTPALKRYLDDVSQDRVPDIWDDVFPVNPMAEERQDYPTQKPESLVERIILSSSNDGDVVADFFCGSGTTGAVAERLGRRWIMADLGRFAIHTGRKRLIEMQRKLHDEGKPYRAFDVLNLGRYERQWWQKERLKGAEEDHRRVVLEFYRAEPIKSSVSPLIHGRKGPTLCHVDAIDGILTRKEVEPVTRAAKEAGAKEVACLAWEFEMDLRMECNRLEKELEIKLKLIPIPREIMEKNRTEPPPFLEVATLEAEPVYRKSNGKQTVDIKLVRFLPSLAEVPSKELQALQERAIKSGFDFIDFWAVDFDYRNCGPFHHDWQDYRTRKDRSLVTVSEQNYVYPKKGKYTACVKVVDIFGCDTSISVEVEYE